MPVPVYPVAVRLDRGSVLVVGGGAPAEAKVASLVAAGARACVVDPVGHPGLAARAAEGQIRYRQGPPRPEDLEGAVLVFAVSGARHLDRQVAGWARERGIWVNCLDDPAACDVFAMAQVRRGPLVVAVTTGGACPALAAEVRRRLDGWLVPKWRALAEEAAALRPKVRGSWRPEDWRDWLAARTPGAPSPGSQGKARGGG